MSASVVGSQLTSSPSTTAVRADGACDESPQLVVRQKPAQRVHVAREPVRRPEVLPRPAVENARPDAVGRGVPLLDEDRGGALVLGVEPSGPRGDHRSRRAPHHFPRRVALVRDDELREPLVVGRVGADRARSKQNAAFAHPQPGRVLARVGQLAIARQGVCSERGQVERRAEPAERPHHPGRAEVDAHEARRIVVRGVERVDRPGVAVERLLGIVDDRRDSILDPPLVPRGLGERLVRGRVVDVGHVRTAQNTSVLSGNVNGPFGSSSSSRPITCARSSSARLAIQLTEDA